jgi:hypothetical protein
MGEIEHPVPCSKTRAAALPDAGRPDLRRRRARQASTDRMRDIAGPLSAVARRYSSVSMQDAIAGFVEAPLWAQGAMVFFAVIAVLMVFGPSVAKRRFRRKFNAIAHALGTQPRGKDWPYTASHQVDGRTFTLTHDYRGSGKGSSYRGPRGYLLTVSTPLAGSGWGMHQVDVMKVGGRLSRLIQRGTPTGDAEFDARFAVVEDGLPVRHRWLDADTRRALAAFFDIAPLDGTLWIREGVLSFIMCDPWTGLDGAAIERLLQQHATLAQALEQP